MAAQSIRKTVLLGGGGFIGSHVASSLREHKTDNLVIHLGRGPSDLSTGLGPPGVGDKAGNTESDSVRSNESSGDGSKLQTNKSTADTDSALGSDQRGVRITTGDLCDQSTIEDLTAGAQCVIHCAGIAHNKATASAYEALHTTATEQLAQACLHNKVERLVYLSTALLNNDDDQSLYTRSKVSAEQILLERLGDKLNLLILRPYHVYGPGMQGNLASMIRRAKCAGLLAMPRSRGRFRFTSVKALAETVAHEALSGSRHGVFTIRDSQSYGLQDIEDAIYRALGRKPPRFPVPLVLPYAALGLARTLESISHSPGGFHSRPLSTLLAGNADWPEQQQHAGFPTGLITLDSDLTEALPALVQG